MKDMVGWNYKMEDVNRDILSSRPVPFTLMSSTGTGMTQTIEA
jgi:hypothetical protein